MKSRRLAPAAFALAVFLSGCATTDQELTQKEKDKLARDMERENQKQSKAQEKAMRDANQGSTRKATR